MPENEVFGQAEGGTKAVGGEGRWRLVTAWSGLRIDAVTIQSGLRIYCADRVKKVVDRFWGLW